MLANLYCIKWLEERENNLNHRNENIGINIPSEIKIISLPDNIQRFNGRTECDMLLGPCSCGAAHSRDEIVDANMEYTNDSDL